MSGSKVYSPVQASLGAFLGGPIASVFFIKQNFVVLNDDEAVKKTNRYGALVITFFISILPFLPENFPNMIIPIITIISTRLLVEKFQFTKKVISNNDDLDFHSNWRVLFVSLISLVVFMIIGVSLLLALDFFGVESLL
jgi:hypothetical protein